MSERDAKENAKAEMETDRRETADEIIRRYYMAYGEGEACGCNGWEARCVHCMAREYLNLAELELTPRGD